MKTEAIDAAVRHMRDALEHVQQARQIVMESESGWAKTTITRTMTDGGKFLLDAERELGRMRDWGAEYTKERCECAGRDYGLCPKCLREARAAGRL